MTKERWESLFKAAGVTDDDIREDNIVMAWISGPCIVKDQNGKWVIFVPHNVNVTVDENEVTQDMEEIYTEVLSKPYWKY